MTPGKKNSYNSLKTISIDNKEYKYYSLKEAEKNGLEGISNLPKSLKVLLENLLRYEDDLSVQEKKERLYELNKIVNDGYLLGNLRFENKVVKVLVDGTSRNSEEMLAGYTENNKLVNFKGEKHLIGEIVEVMITEVKTWSLNGELVG